MTSTAPIERARFYCALGEQRSHPDHPLLSLLFSIPSRARENGMRGTARVGSTARIERAHSYRARSASKEGTWPLPFSPFLPQTVGEAIISVGWPDGTLLRASNEHLLSVRVPRAKRPVWPPH